jgi:D-tyrosyl-tRNA(Tyr) deacylase
MRVVLQRVRSAEVVVDGNTVGQIGKGLLVLAGISGEDTEDDLRYMAGKIVNLRIFEDEERKLNRSLLDIKGEMLVISQFTLYADCRKGRRPSFVAAAPPDKASVMFDRFVDTLKEFSLKVETGVFQAMMDISLCNYGPVTITMDSGEMKKR